MDAPTEAIILLGHGSRDPQWRQPIEAVADRLATRRPGVAVRCAYLELEPPHPAAAMAQLAAAGVHRVTIVPMFLGTGKHGRDDLSSLLERLRREHPGIDFDMQRPVGEDARVLDLLARIAAE